jgi:uncharacterized protein YdeI (BOF family)
MKRVILLFTAAVFIGSGVAQAETWKGTISDAMCAKKHANMHDDKEVAGSRACIEKCVKDGQPYAFVAGDKVFKIGNQKFAGLAAHAGHEVNLTGTMKGDTITVSKIEMPAKPAPKK